MIDAQRQVVVAAPADAVFAYLADFTTTTQWDPGTVRTERIAGDGGVGTRYANTSRFAGRTSEITYEVTSLTPGQSIELRGVNRYLVARDTITVVPHVDGTAVTYRIRFAFQGWLRWIEPLLQLAVARLLDDGARGLRRELARI
ncbi:SRPBCC family protein [Mycolicibacterium phocaicum]|uniref:Polyketide cyclase n=1 Tax=Mycolicibacterium phocaicum TaxID=319706 RepID=A0A7I7ZWM6_9MYCO|nr:SRPBCC family protein [Mycolicibacterium phocaicum]TLH64782.1 polyketide cyclase [Mycolicibacterium phocaicum]BBZ58390.1 polyketide cyclase [Mycolicibacterium phocaicum]